MNPGEKNGREGWSASPFVSVIIPAKNEEKMLPACLSSLLALDYPKDCYEIVLADNGSTDNTVRIAKERGVRVCSYPGVTIGGLRNLGARAAEGDILAFVDADVVVSKSWLSAAIECLKRHPGAVCVGAFPLAPPEYGWVAKTWQHLQLPIGAEDEREVKWLASMNMILRRGCFEKVGGFSEDLVTAEDVDLCYRMGAEGTIVYSKDIEAFHYGEALSLWHLFKKERWRGRSNYDGVGRHGLRMDELPSLLLPVYYFAILLFLVCALVVGDFWLMAVIALLSMLPPVAKSLQSVTKHNYDQLPAMAICYFVYSIARTVAAFDWLKMRIHRKS